MKKILLTTAAALALLAGCKPSDDSAKTIRMKYSVFFMPEHIHAKMAQAWAKEIEARTGGRVKITVYTAGSLTGPAQCYQGVLDGVSDLGMSAFAYTRGRFPLLEGLDLPHGYPDGVTATRIANELIEQFKPAELDNVKFLFCHAHGPGMLATRKGKNVETLEDIKNKKLKVRATGFGTATVEALGGTPVGMPQNDTYEALQRGTVDATFCPVETLKGWNQGEVVESVTDTGCIGYTTVFYVVMNKQVWENLPEDIQHIITEFNREWIIKLGVAWNEADEEGLEYIASLNPPRNVFTLSEDEQARWRAAVQPVIEDYVKGDTPELPRRAFLEALQKAIAE